MHNDQRPEWLRQLSEKSWNLELIISGAAIFLAIGLPNAVDRMLHFYFENLVTDDNLGKISLPLLAYSFAKVVAWLLIITFLAHFVMRAFWAGLVGLHAVYPQGIRYQHLPGQTELSRQQAEKKFGLLSDYILRLDRLCNQIFSFAFLIALFSLGIGMSYLMIFFIITMVPLLLGPEKGKIVSVFLLLLVVVVAILPALAQTMMRSKKLAERPWAQRFMHWSMWYAPAIIIPVVYRPASYLNLTFSSNVTKKRLYTVMVATMLVALGGVLLIFVHTIKELSGRTGFSTQIYFARKSGPYTLMAPHYDNLRPEGAFLPPVSIPADVLDAPFLRVFVSYPKSLDGALAQHCVVPALPDSLSRNRRLSLLDSLHVRCFSDFLKVSVNDSLYSGIDWVFHEHAITGTRGLVAYLPSAKFLPGKNVLTLRVPTAEKADSLRVFDVVPFWYAPK